MAIKLDDFLSKKKEPAQVLDLSKIKITSKDEFRKYFDKIPEYKIKPEKVMPETIKIRDKDFSFIPGRREEKQSHDWSYPDPTPPDMKAVKLEDLCPVNIDWKMLTTLRPKTKTEEDMFSRLVQLGKLDLKYQQSLRREKDTEWVRKTKNPRSSIVETRVICCKECGEDFCDGFLCCKLMYENFFRATTSAAAAKDANALEAGGEIKKKKKKKHKRKSRKRTRSKVRRRKPRKNSIFNRPASRGCSRDHSRRGSHANIAEKIQAQSAARAASLSRSRSRERRPSEADLPRAKSAPRIHFKGEIMEEPSGTHRPGYGSDSGPTQTDYSSQSDSESSPYRQRSRLKLPGKRKQISARVGFADGYQSDTGEYPTRSRFVRECTLMQEYKGYYSDASGMESQESNDSLSESLTPSPSRSRSTSKSPEKYFHLMPSSSGPKRPSTIQIEFDELTSASNVYFPAKSYAPTKFVTASARKSDLSSMGTLRNQEVTKIMEGFSKIELAFTEDKASTSQISSLKTQRSLKGVYNVPKLRPKTSHPKMPTSYLKGKGLLTKPP